MNSLSLLIYLADVCEGAKLIGILGSMACAFTLGALTIAYMAESVAFPRAVYRALAAGLVLCLLVGVLAPNKKTVYLIAASEAGERAANSDTGKAVLNETRDLLLKKLRELNAEK